MAENSADERTKLRPTISFRVTEDVYADFESQCKAANMSKSELIRDYIVKNRVYVNARPVPRPATRRAMLLLRKTSSNIDLLVHRAQNDKFNGHLVSEAYKEFINQLVQLNKFMHIQMGQVKNDY